MFVSSYTYAKNPVKCVDDVNANDAVNANNTASEKHTTNANNTAHKEYTNDTEMQTNTLQPTIQLDSTHLWVQKDEYKRFDSYFRSKYLVTSYALYLARHQPSLKTVICDPGVAATNIARELGCIGRLYALPFFQLFAPTAKGACTIAFAAGSGKVETMESGVMLKNCRRKELIRQIQNEDEQEAIRRVTMEALRSIE